VKTVEVANLVDAVRHILDSGGNGSILLNLHESKLVSMRVRTGEVNTELLGSLRVERSPLLDRRCFIDRVIQILEDGGYGNIYEEIHNGVLVKCDFSITERPRHLKHQPQDVKRKA
jgi:hypothetical protein